MLVKMIGTEEIDAQYKELVSFAEERYRDSASSTVHYVDNDDEADALLNNIKDYPHLFTLACIMDKQMKAEKAWMIPIKIGRRIGGFEFERYASLPEEKYHEYFVDADGSKLHRFNNTMPTIFYKAVQRIKEKYNSDASNIWKGNPSSALLVLKFLEFEGVGVKIATMAANILVRQYRIPVRDKVSIDISPDVHVKKVFYRMGFIDRRDNDEVIYKAREIYPMFPGIIDFATWEIGRTFCLEKNPKCSECPLSTSCKKRIENIR